MDSDTLKSEAESLHEYMFGNDKKISSFIFIQTGKNMENLKAKRQNNLRVRIRVR